MAKNSLVGERVTDKKQVADLVLLEWDQRYNRETVDLSEGTYEIGDVLTNESVASASSKGHQPSFSDVICLENITIPTGESREVAVFARGPALLNMDAVTRTTNESDADLRTRLADLVAQGVKFVREPAVQSTLDLDS